MAETEREQTIRMQKEEWCVRNIAKKLEYRQIEPRHCYVLLDHSFGEQKSIFRNALNSNKILKDIYEQETFTYQECYKIEAIGLENTIDTFLSSDKIFEKYKGKILHNVWRTAIRKFYETKIQNNNIKLTDAGANASQYFKPKKEIQ